MWCRIAHRKSKLNFKEKIQVDGNKEEFVHTSCLDIQQGMNAYLEVEKLLVSMLLKMGIFQLKT